MPPQTTRVRDLPEGTIFKRLSTLYVTLGDSNWNRSELGPTKTVAGVPCARKGLYLQADGTPSLPLNTEIPNEDILGTLTFPDNPS